MLVLAAVSRLQHAQEWKEHQCAYGQEEEVDRHHTGDDAARYPQVLAACSQEPEHNNQWQKRVEDSIQHGIGSRVVSCIACDAVERHWA